MNKAKQKTTDIEPMIKKTRARSETAQLAVRSLILNTARKLFQANDVDLISLRSIAREVDMAPGALYTYFPSKISLMRAVWAEDLARLNVELSAYPKESTLLDFSCFFVDYWLKNASAFKALFLVTDEPDNEGGMFIESPEVIDLLRIIKQRVVSKMSNEMHPDAQETDFRAFLASIHGVISIAILVPELGWTNTRQILESQVSAFLLKWSRNAST